MKINSQKTAVMIGGAAVLALFVAGWFRGTSPKPTPGASKPRSEDHCELVGGNHWRISRGARTEYFRDPERLHRDLQLQPIPGPGSITIQELRVSKVAPDSPMYRAGFKVGDRIHQVNGQTVSTLTRALNLSHEFQVNDRIAVKIERDGTLVEYQFEFD